MYSTLQDLAAEAIACKFTTFNINDVKQLPSTVLQSLYGRLSPINLRKLEVALGSSEDTNQDIWMKHYKKTFPNYFRSLFKASQTNENVFCIVCKRDGDFRRMFMEDHFHALLEDANKIIILIQRGVLEVNLANASAHDAKSNCDVRLKEIKADMLICAPFVRSLKVFRSKGLMSPLLTDILHVLANSVICIRLVFLHDYRILKDTLDFFMKYGKIKDFHTTWQPQRCALQPKCAVEILTLLSGLQINGVPPIDDAVVQDGAVALEDSQYDLFDIAVAGPRLDVQGTDMAFDCAAGQSGQSLSHINISSFILTQHQQLHYFIANTLLERWHTLESLKLSCLNHIGVDMFKRAIIYLVEHHKLRQLCFEDSQFINPMDFFIALVRVLIKHKDIQMRRLTMLGIGHPFCGDFSHELLRASQFLGIRDLDLSFSSFHNASGVATLCAYLRRDSALHSLNMNCCKLLPAQPTADILTAIGASTVRELVFDFNPLNSEETQQALIQMLTENRAFTLLSFTLCTFTQTFLSSQLFPTLAHQSQLRKLFLAENRIGDMSELKEFLVSILCRREHLEYLDLSSNLLSGVFLLNLAQALEEIANGKQLFIGLNLNFNMDRSEIQVNGDLVRGRLKSMCKHLSCMILYEDPAEPARQEHMAQM